MGAETIIPAFGDATGKIVGQWRMIEPGRAGYGPMDGRWIWEEKEQGERSPCQV